MNKVCLSHWIENFELGIMSILLYILLPVYLLHSRCPEIICLIIIEWQYSINTW